MADIKHSIRKGHKSTVKAAQYSWSLIEKAGAGFWLGVFLIFCIVAFFIFDISIIVSNLVTQYGLIGIVLLSYLLDFLVQPVGPDIPLITGVIVGLNPWLVLLCVITGSGLALICTYYIGKYLGEPGIKKILGKKRWHKIQNKTYGKWALVLGAATPVPYIPYLTGLYNFSVYESALYVLLPRSIRFCVVMIAAIYLGKLFV